MTGPSSEANPGGPGPLPQGQLSTWEKAGLVALAVVLVGFGVVVEIRAAFLHKRMTDLAVFLRAGWAVRAGRDLYTITDDKGLHYHYPPVFAVLLVPFADPPAAAQATGQLPFAVSVALWYVVSLACLAAGSHGLASALEKAAPSWPRAGSRSWWTLRLHPALGCVPALALALSLGQVTPLLALLLCGTAAALIRGKHWQAGFWLAAAICLKVIPAFLLLYPLWRRNGRCLGGCALGLTLGLAVVPGAVFGVGQTVAYYRDWTRVLILPALAIGEDSSRATELLDMTATHNQSLMALFHNTLYPDPENRPEKASPLVRRLHWIVGTILTAVTLLAARWRRRDSATEVVLFLGALVINMLLLSPAGHHHYYGLLLLPTMGLLARARQRGEHSAAVKGVLALLALNFVASGLPMLPGMKGLHDRGTVLFAALVIWAMSLSALWRAGSLERDSSARGTPKVEDKAGRILVPG